MNTSARRHNLIPNEATLDLSGMPPWQLSRAYAYLSRSALHDGGTANASRCMRALWDMRRAVEAADGFHDLPSPGLLTSTPFVAMW